MAIALDENQRFGKMLSVVAEMAPLTERQQTAQAIAAELERLGAWCISPMPLNEDNRLRFQVLTSGCESILQRIGEWGWSPILCNHGLRFTPRGAEPSIIYEIDIPRTRQPVVDDRIRGEIASDKAMNAELEGFRRLKLS